MFDVTGPTGPGGPPPAQGPKGKKPPSSAPKEKFLGMEVTQKQKQKIYANMCNMIIQQIKHDQKRQKKAMKKLRKSTEENI